MIGEKKLNIPFKCTESFIESWSILPVDVARKKGIKNRLILFVLIILTALPSTVCTHLITSIDKFKKEISILLTSFYTQKKELQQQHQYNSKHRT